MAQILENLVAQAEITRTVMVKATTYINGSAQRFQDAVAAAVKGGATAEELGPIQAEIDSLKSRTDDLSIAIAANP